MPNNQSEIAQTPLLTVRCFVYNQAEYLRQCLDGFVMQQTTFPFEAIVHDDASTDESADIIREYAEKYPHIIKPIIETENQYTKHDGSLTRVVDAAMHPGSKYIAYCEGDDYWCDPHKLQLQVDFLESHPDYYMTCHAFKYYMQAEDKYVEHDFVEGLPMEEFEGHEYCTPTMKDYFCSAWYTQLLTIVRRRVPFAEAETMDNYKGKFDYIMCYYMMKKGRCALFKDVMGIYRKHSGGIFSGTDQRKWNQLAFDENMTLYRLENEKLVIHKLNYFFVELFSGYVHKKQFGKAASILMRYITGLKFSHLAEVVLNKVRGKHC